MEHASGAAKVTVGGIDGHFITSTLRFPWKSVFIPGSRLIGSESVDRMNVCATLIGRPMTCHEPQDVIVSHLFQRMNR